MRPMFKNTADKDTFGKKKKKANATAAVGLSLLARTFGVDV